MDYSEGRTISVMSPRKKNSQKPQPRVDTSAEPPSGEAAPTGPNRSGKPINIWVDDDIYQALEDYRNAQTAEPSKTRVVEVALKEFLRREGFYPPAKK